MFSTLLQLPLFQGLNQEDFTNILGKVKLRFLKHKEDNVIAKEGVSCNELIFLLQGELTSTTVSEDKSYTLIEKFQAPYLIEPYSLFGMNTQYRSTYTAREDSSTVSIEKSFILKELFRYEIFRINFSNNICSRVQTFNKRIWSDAPNSVSDKIIQFILIHSERPDGEKTLRIKMEDLARYIDDTRLNVSKTLNDLQEKGLVQLNRKEIFIPDCAKLLQP